MTQYLTEEAASRTLGFGGKSAPGSILLFTYALKSIIDGHSNIPDADKMMETVQRQAPWIYGLEPSSIKSYLRQFHLTLIADVGNADYQEKYLKPLGRILSVFEGERIVHAIVE